MSTLLDINVDVQVVVTRTLLLTDDERRRLLRPVRGIGGFQSLLKKLQSQLDGNRLVLTEEDARRMKRYSTYNKTAGGFQQRLLDKHPSEV